MAPCVCGHVYLVERFYGHQRPELHRNCTDGYEADVSSNEEDDSDVDGNESETERHDSHLLKPITLCPGGGGRKRKRVDTEMEVEPVAKKIEVQTNPGTTSSNSSLSNGAGTPPRSKKMELSFPLTPASEAP